VSVIDVSACPALNNRTLEWAENGKFLISSRNLLTRHAGLHKPAEAIWAIPQELVRGTLCRLRLFQRLMRQFYYNCLPLPDGRIFVSFGRSMGFLAGEEFTLLQGPSHGFRVLRGGVALTPGGDLFFGQYFGNPDRGPVAILRIPQGGFAAEVAYQFAAGSVRHVHGVFCDPYSGDLWCLTGDRPTECRIVRSADGFGRVETIGQGDESWRSVSVQFSEKSIYYATDAEFERNRLFRIDRATGARETLCELDGPVYYSTRIGKHLFFAVTAELCPSQVGREASLWHVGDGIPARKIWAAEKDRFSPKWFLRGMLHFAQGPGSGNETYFNAVALRGLDNRSFRISVEDQPC
jgi:hypothetical protein